MRPPGKTAMNGVTTPRDLSSRKQKKLREYRQLLLRKIFRTKIASPVAPPADLPMPNRILRPLKKVPLPAGRTAFTINVFPLIDARLLRR
jgi:hypothetical protein